MKDPIVEEIREIRREHAERFGYDLDAICEDIRKHEAISGQRFVQLEPRRIPAEKHYPKIG